MRTLLLVGPLIVTLLLLGQVCRAEEFGLGNTMTLKSAYVTPLNKPVRPSDFILQAEDRPTRSVLATASFLQGRLVSEGEVAYTGTDSRSRLLRLALTGTHGRLRYGINYRTAGKFFINTPDQTMREVWGEWSVGIARFRSSMTETHDNLDKEPDRSRVMHTQERMAVTVAPPAWAEVGLSYTRSFTSSSLDPLGVSPQRTRLDTLEGTVTYPRSTWQARFSSTYSLNRDWLIPGGETVGLAHALSASYSPTKALNVSPSISLREDRQLWSGVQSETRSGSLSLTYAPDATFTLRASGSYNKTRSSDGLVDLSRYDAKAGVSWASQAKRFRKSLSFEAGYAHSLDRINRALSADELSGLLHVQLTWF